MQLLVVCAVLAAAHVREPAEATHVLAAQNTTAPSSLKSEGQKLSGTPIASFLEKMARTASRWLPPWRRARPRFEELNEADRREPENSVDREFRERRDFRHEPKPKWKIAESAASRAEAAAARAEQALSAARAADEDAHRVDDDVRNRAEGLHSPASLLGMKAKFADLPACDAKAGGPSAGGDDAQCCCEKSDGSMWWPEKPKEVTEDNEEMFPVGISPEEQCGKAGGECVCMGVTFQDVCQVPGGGGLSMTMLAGLGVGVFVIIVGGFVASSNKGGASRGRSRREEAEEEWEEFEEEELGT